MSSTSRFLMAAATTTAVLAVPSGVFAQSLGCSTGGGGGAFPTSGSGGSGNYPATFPPFALTTTLNVASIPAGATQITGVVLHSLTHTYTNDVSIVLDDPSGTRYMLFDEAMADCDWNGDYTIVSPGEGVPWSCNNGGLSVNPGTYTQYFGGWPSGTNSVNNVALNAIPLATGTWKITFYDWAGGDVGALASWDLCMGTAPPPPPPPPPPAGSVCSAPMGSGGYIPTTESGDGNWPGTMPTYPMVAPLNVTVPAGSTQIKAITLRNLAHTWVGDLQVTLKDPSGVEHNLVHRPGLVGTCCGFDCDLSGDYVIWETFGADFATQCTPGDYFQTFGTWPDGTNGIFNTPLSSIPVVSGTYTLTIYDWAAGDLGTLANWEVCFDAPSGPVVYCTAGTSTNGCVPAIGASAEPSASFSHPCVISVSSLEGQKFGIVFYGLNNTGFSPTIWAAGSTSFLCVKGPTQRTGTQNSNGVLNQCNGSMTRDWNAYQSANPAALGNPFAAGNKVYVQCWYRDPPAPKTTNLSDAVALTVVP